jgi:hypothetical protein
VDVGNVSKKKFPNYYSTCLSKASSKMRIAHKLYSNNNNNNNKILRIYTPNPSMKPNPTIVLARSMSGRKKPTVLGEPSGRS